MPRLVPPKRKKPPGPQQDTLRIDGGGQPRPSPYRNLTSNEPPPPERDNWKQEREVSDRIRLRATVVRWSVGGLMLLAGVSLAVLYVAPVSWSAWFAAAKF